jgi:hypothetical protein
MTTNTQPTVAEHADELEFVFAQNLRGIARDLRAGSLKPQAAVSLLGDELKGLQLEVDALRETAMRDR